jgi:Tol biopolymer transport system component
VADADGTGARVLFDCAAPCGWSDHPAWSPDGRTIAFVSADHVGDVDSLAYIDLLNVATGEHRHLLQAPKLAWCYVPRWAPDGARLVVECDTFQTARYDEEHANARTIGVVDTTAGTPAFEPLLPWSSWAQYPDWHPSENRIVFQLPTDLGEPTGAADIALLDPASSEQTVITHFGPTGGWAIQPTWTPDGSAITFVAEDVVRTHPNAASIAADGTGLQRMRDAYYRTHPRLRPTP